MFKFSYLLRVEVSREVKNVYIYFLKNLDFRVDQYIKYKVCL